MIPRCLGTWIAIATLYSRVDLCYSYTGPILPTSYKSVLAVEATAVAVKQKRQLLSSEWIALAKNCNQLSEDISSNALFEVVRDKLVDPSLSYTRWALETEVCGKAANKGRPAVQASLSRFQKMVMALDRSDGVSASSDPSPYAEKYIDLINTCIRTGGPAWTAALSGITYAGLRMGTFITPYPVRKEGEDGEASVLESKSIDIVPLVNKAATLLDHGKSALDWNTVGMDATLKCSDMMYGLIQIAIRLAILQEELNDEPGGAGKGYPFVLKVQAPITAPNGLPYVPVSSMVEGILSLDLGLPATSTTDGEVQTFEVSKDAVEDWAKKNALQ